MDRSTEPPAELEASCAQVDEDVVPVQLLQVAYTSQQQGSIINGALAHPWEAVSLRPGGGRQTAKETPEKGGIREQTAMLGLSLLLLCVGFTLPALGYLWWAAKHGATEVILSLGLLCAFQDTLSFLLPLIDSLGLAKALGRGSIFSGVIVGIYRGAGPLGSLALWLVLKLHPETWHSWGAVFHSTLAFQVTCAVVIFLICNVLIDLWPQRTLQEALLAARAVQGFFGGIINSLTCNLVARLVPPSERPARMMSINLAWTMGLGLAPLVSSAASWLAMPAVRSTTAASYRVTVSAAVWLPFLNLICLRAFQPYRAGTGDGSKVQDLGEASEPGSSEGGTTRQALVVLLCLAAMPVRAFSIASMEAGVSYILEEMHGWDTRLVGLATGATFLSCLPLKAFFDRFRDAIAVTSWLRIWVGASLAGTLLFHPRFSSGAPQLLLACVVTFPTIFLSGGLMAGIMQNHCFPSGSILDLNTGILINEVGTNLVGRFLGPPAARWALDQGGLWRYWQMQLLVAIVAVLLAEVIVCCQSEALMGCPAAGLLAGEDKKSQGGGMPDEVSQDDLTAHATSRVPAEIMLMRDDVAFACESACEVQAGGRQGFELNMGLMEPCTVLLETIPADASLEREGVQVLSCLDELREAGITESSCDLSQQENRLKVGAAMTRALARHFGSSKILVHAADTSRVSGVTVYGEATIRDTASCKALRTRQSGCHIDHFLPGIAKYFGRGTSVGEGADALLDALWHIWSTDFDELGIGRAAVRECLIRKGFVNLWAALTPGAVQQHPLAVIDKRSVDLGGEGALRSLNTVPLKFPAMETTLTVLRSRTSSSARWLWKPKMQFGDMLLFSTTETPHAAARVSGAPDARRQSAEMRFLVLDGA